MQDAVRAQEEITSLFVSHVTGANAIYSNTIFQGKNDQGTQVSYTGFTLAVRRVLVSVLFLAVP